MPADVLRRARVSSGCGAAPAPAGEPSSAPSWTASGARGSMPTPWLGGGTVTTTAHPLAQVRGIMVSTFNSISKFKDWPEK